MFTARQKKNNGTFFLLKPAEDDTTSGMIEIERLWVELIISAGLGTDGPFNNVIKIKPPMVITKEDADMFIRVFDDVLLNLENAF